MSGEVKAGADTSRAPSSQKIQQVPVGRRRDADDWRPDHGHHRRDRRQGADGHHGARGRAPRRRAHPDAVPPPGPVRGGRLPRVRGGGRRAARAAGGVRVPDHQLAEGEDPHAQGAPGAASHPRPAALDALRRVLQLQAEQQLRAAGAGEGVRRRLLPLRPRHRVAGAEGRVELLRRPRHGQVHPVPPLRAHLHRHPGGRRARGGRAEQQDPHLDVPRQAARRRRVHQLRAVHQPLPDRRPARQRLVGRHLARHRRPDQARGHPDGAEPAGRHRRVLRLRARHADDLPDEHRAQARGLRQGVRHELQRRPHHHRGRHGTARAAVQGPREGRTAGVPAVHQLLAGLGEVPRALLPGVHPEPVVGQEPAADVRRRSSRPTTRS